MLLVRSLEIVLLSLFIINIINGQELENEYIDVEDVIEPGETEAEGNVTGIFKKKTKNFKICRYYILKLYRID